MLGRSVNVHFTNYKCLLYLKEHEWAKLQGYKHMYIENIQNR